MVNDLFIIGAAWFIGAFINGLTGMGGMLIALPLITLFVSSKTVILISIIISVLVSLMSFALYWRYINVRDVIGFWLPAIPGILLGVRTLKIVDVEILELLLCLIIVMHIIVQLVQDWLGTCMAPRSFMKWGCGFFAGFFGGSIGINGPVMAMYASLICMEKNEARGFFTSSTPASIVSLGVIMIHGLITEDVIRSVSFIAPVAVAGFLCAWPLAKRIRQGTFHNALLILLGVAAVSLFMRVMPYLSR